MKIRTSFNAYHGREELNFLLKIWGRELDRIACVNPCRLDWVHERRQVNIGREQQLRSREGAAVAANQRPWAGAVNKLRSRGLEPSGQSWGGYGGLELGSLSSRNSCISYNVYVEWDREDGEHRLCQSQGTDDWSQREEDIGEESQCELNLNRGFF